jgi:hypothetical protein
LWSERCRNQFEKLSEGVAASNSGDEARVVAGYHSDGGYGKRHVFRVREVRVNRNVMNTRRDD